MSFRPEQWNDGVELAFILNRAIDLGDNWELMEDANASVEADRLDEDMDKIALSKRIDVNCYLNSHRPLFITPEPYRSLTDSISDFTFRIMVRNIERRYGATSTQTIEATQTAEQVQEKFHEAIGKLIGRDVYVWGMNPYELKQPPRAEL
jgi:hypothetical protein